MVAPSIPPSYKAILHRPVVCPYMLCSKKARALRIFVLNGRSSSAIMVYLRDKHFIIIVRKQYEKYHERQFNWRFYDCVHGVKREHAHVIQSCARFIMTC